MFVQKRSAGKSGQVDGSTLVRLSAKAAAAGLLSGTLAACLALFT